MSLLYAIGKAVITPAVWLGWRPTVSGVQHVPATGAAILAGNHLSAADEIFLGAVVPRKISFLGKAEYFHAPGLKGAAIGAMMRSLDVIPVHRDGGRASLLALDEALPVLARGGLVGIYPEGTRSVDGKLYRGRTGVAKLAVDSGVPVIPVGILGTDKVQPIGQRLPRRSGEVRISFGEPLDFAGRDPDRASLRAITDEIMVAIQELTGQDYSGRYAPRRHG